MAIVIELKWAKVSASCAPNKTVYFPHSVPLLGIVGAALALESGMQVGTKRLPAVRLREKLPTLAPGPLSIGAAIGASASSFARRLSHVCAAWLVRPLAGAVASRVVITTLILLGLRCPPPLVWLLAGACAS